MLQIYAISLKLPNKKGIKLLKLSDFSVNFLKLNLVKLLILRFLCYFGGNVYFCTELMNIML